MFIIDLQTLCARRQIKIRGGGIFKSLQEFKDILRMWQNVHFT